MTSHDMECISEINGPGCIAMGWHPVRDYPLLVITTFRPSHLQEFLKDLYDMLGKCGIKVGPRHIRCY